METDTDTQTFVIDYSTDDGKTWHFGMERPEVMRDSLAEFRSVVRYGVARHGRGVKTRVR